MAIEPVPEEQGIAINDQGSERQEAREQGNEGTENRVTRVPRTQLETRLETALAALSARSRAPSATERQGHLALLKRWYYRPEAKRTGEIFFPDADGHWPMKAVLRGIGRVAAKSLIDARHE
jgi:excinuclease ABC subunit C